MGDLSRHFSRAEYSCKCGCGLDNIDLQLISISEIIRHHEGDKSMTPNSACRCVEHNEKVQKIANKNYTPFSSTSKHLPFGLYDLCRAGDFKSENPKKLYDFLDSLFGNIYGLGVYNWGIHVDTRPEKARWNNQ